jgi:hypothetical protein
MRCGREVGMQQYNERHIGWSRCAPPQYSQHTFVSLLFVKGAAVSKVGDRKVGRNFQLTIHDSALALRLKMAGALASAEVGEVELCWRTAASTMAGRRFVVDLTYLESVDVEGRALLARMYAGSAEFVGATPTFKAVANGLPGALPLETDKTTVGRPLEFPGKAVDAGSTPPSAKPRISLAEKDSRGRARTGVPGVPGRAGVTHTGTIDEPSHFPTGWLR